MSRRKKLQLPVSSSSSSSSVSCSVISSYFKSESPPEKSVKLSKFIAREVKPVESPVPKKTILNFLNLDEDLEHTPVKKVKKAPAPKAKKPKKEKVSKKQPKIKSALLKQEEALSEAITYQSLTEDIDPDELRLALAISRSEAESKGLPVDDLASLKKFVFTKQAKTTRSWLKGRGKWANKISALTLRDPKVESERLKERVDAILENIDINLNLPRAADDFEEVILIFTSPELCGLIDHRKLLNKGENLEAIESLEDYYIADLFEPSKAKAGHLLKSYKYIPGRENSPKKNMDSVIYEILDDCEILSRIDGTSSSSQKECEETENTFQEYDVVERLEEDITEVKVSVEKVRQEKTENEKQEDIVEGSDKKKSVKQKHEGSDYQSPCSSPLEKKRKVAEIFMSPDLFCDSDEDDHDNNVLDRGVVEMISDEETVIVEAFKPPPIKNPSQLFGSDEPSTETIKIDLETASTLEVNTNDEIFDLTQTLDDSESEVETRIEHDSGTDVPENKEEVQETLILQYSESKKIQVIDDSSQEQTAEEILEKEEVTPNTEPETFDLTQCLDSESEENLEVRAPSPELFDLTEDIFQEPEDESSSDVIVLSDDEDEVGKIKDESIKEILGRELDSESNITEIPAEDLEESFPKKRSFRNSLTQPESKPRMSVIVPMEDLEEEDTPPKKRRSKSFENDCNLSPEPTKTRRSRSFHETNDSPVNVCNLTFEELRLKYGFSNVSTPAQEVPSVRKSFSQPAPTLSPEGDDDDFFDKLILNKFKKRPIREPSPDSQCSNDSIVIATQSQEKAMTQPIPSTSTKISSVPSTSKNIPPATQPVPSTSSKKLITSRKSSQPKKTNSQKKTKDQQEVIINQKTYLIRTENIPEKPDYAQMDKETLSVYLKMYGLKELTRKQAVAILDHIYNQMHPLMVEETDDEDF